MKDDRPYLLHIRDAIEWILEDTAEGQEAFLANRTIRDAVVRNLEVIGEATKNLSDRLKNTYPHVPWRDIASLRDRLIHGYFNINQQITWDIVTQDVPALKREIEKILGELDEP